MPTQKTVDNPNKPQSRKALIIAVSDYGKESDLSPLLACMNDGTSMYNLLKNQYTIPKKWKLVGRVNGQQIREAIF